MVDVHIVEAALLIERNEGVVSRDKTSMLYNGIFSKYHISRSLYENNLNYYSLNPELFAKMYEKVIAQLQDQQKGFIPEN